MSEPSLFLPEIEITDFSEQLKLSLLQSSQPMDLSPPPTQQRSTLGESVEALATTLSRKAEVPHGNAALPQPSVTAEPSSPVRKGACSSTTHLWGNHNHTRGTQICIDQDSYHWKSDLPAPKIDRSNNKEAMSGVQTQKRKDRRVSNQIVEFAADTKPADTTTYLSALSPVTPSNAINVSSDVHGSADVILPYPSTTYSKQTADTSIDSRVSNSATASLPKSLSPHEPLSLAPPGTRPVLNRYYSTPMNPMSPSRQHFRLHNPVPHHVKETPTINYLEDARGKFINQYQITRVVGRGSFGMVYLAVDPQGQKYALKECSKRRLAKLNRAAIMRLRRQIVTRGSGAPTAGEISSLITREIAIMKKLDHPNLCTLFEVLDDPDSESLILVLEWCPQGTIMPAEEDYDGKAKPISEPQSRLYFRDLILGVEYLHARGICHRDIKADNVLLGEGDVVKIADFGVSEIFDLTKNEDDNIQRPVGSLAYMSPELVMLHCGNSISPPNTTDPSPYGSTSNTPRRPNLHPAHAPISGRKADIWAMGVTLYYMVHGRLPFEGSNVAGLHHSILTTDPDLSSCSPDLADLLKRIFTKSPAERITLMEMREHPWVTQRGQDLLLSVEENVDVSEHDMITEEDIRTAIDLIQHRPGAPKLDYSTITRSLRANHGWHGSNTASESSSGARTPHQFEVVGDFSPPQQLHSPSDSLKMEKLSRALEELLKSPNTTPELH